MSRFRCQTSRELSFLFGDSAKGVLSKARRFTLRKRVANLGSIAIASAFLFICVNTTEANFLVPRNDGNQVLQKGLRAIEVLAMIPKRNPLKANLEGESQSESQSERGQTTETNGSRFPSVLRSLQKTNEPIFLRSIKFRNAIENQHLRSNLLLSPLRNRNPFMGFLGLILLEGPIVSWFKNLGAILVSLGDLGRLGLNLGARFLGLKILGVPPLTLA